MSLAQLTVLPDWKRSSDALVLVAAPAGGVLLSPCKGANLVAAYVMGCISSNMHTCD